LTHTLILLFINSKAIGALSNLNKGKKLQIDPLTRLFTFSRNLIPLYSRSKPYEETIVPIQYRPSAEDWERILGFLDDWNLNFDEINELLTDNPSLRSFVSGYAAELKCRNIWFLNNSSVSQVKKYDDHDRNKKGDISFVYKGHEFNVEVKSLQTNSIKKLEDGTLKATFQCDASDRRPVKFPDGSTVETTCLLVGEFDILAVNLFGFTGKWDFVFARNFELPRVSGLRGAAKEYSEYQRSLLLASSMPITYPVSNFYHDNPWSLLDDMVLERNKSSR
jgi:hypothetical protein